MVTNKPTANTLKVMASVYFSPDVRPEDTLQFMPMIGNESDQAVAEMVTLPFAAATRTPQLPALVMGGSHDALFPASMLFFTALPWRARTVTIDRAGHMLMLAPQWPQAAEALGSWLDSLPPRAA